MTDEVMSNITEYYNKVYGTPGSDAEAVDTLHIVFKDLIGEEPTSEVREGIAEYYRNIEGRGLPAYLWILEALHITSKKESQKRNFPYMVGMLRSWLRYGFGHIPNKEEEDIVKYFEEVTGQEVTVQARKLLQNLMGSIGCIKVTIMINELKNKADISYILMAYLQTLCDEEQPLSDAG